MGCWGLAGTGGYCDLGPRLCDRSATIASQAVTDLANWGPKAKVLSPPRGDSDPNELSLLNAAGEEVKHLPQKAGLCSATAAGIIPPFNGKVVRCYVKRTEQLVVAFRDGMVGEAISKNHLAGGLLYVSASPEPIGRQAGRDPPTSTMEALTLAKEVIVLGGITEDCNHRKTL
ncbi:hypothetical protein EYF80_023864 [Liparis tanakae]|uniref:Uncharacterized protein n=1 Tax=Liparis tanakae TaxID=230148 RepID=A0A4Z2HLP4_9TELE|nr:hypothetical protein EYF80_023864 [Liparis tanakae]